jgi:hypothetical protein
MNNLYVYRCITIASVVTSIQIQFLSPHVDWVPSTWQRLSLNLLLYLKLALKNVDLKITLNGLAAKNMLAGFFWNVTFKYLKNRKHV